MIRINLPELLGRARMTQKELAEKTKIRPATISAIYHERIKRIEIDQIDRICNVLNCTPGELFTFIPKQNK